MSAEIIILLVGGLLLLLAVVDSIPFNNGSLGLMSTKVRIPLGIIGVLLLIYSGYTYGMINVVGQIEQVATANRVDINYPVESVQITSPVADDVVECRTLTRGVYPESHDRDIWVLLQPSDGKYYPQSDHTNTSYKSDGEWQVITRYGGDAGETFDVVVYEADPTASQFFTATIVEWNEAQSYPGLEPAELPAGAREVDRIQVTLQKNCRGVH